MNQNRFPIFLGHDITSEPIALILFLVYSLIAEEGSNARKC